jgi:hypothetical protein
MIDIVFMNDKEQFVPIRGVPFKASFSAEAVSKDNLLTGSAMDKHIKKELERLTALMDALNGTPLIGTNCSLSFKN